MPPLPSCLDAKKNISPFLCVLPREKYFFSNRNRKNNSLPEYVKFLIQSYSLIDLEYGIYADGTGIILTTTFRDVIHATFEDQDRRV